MGGSGLINWSHSTPQLLMCMASVQFAQSGRNETHPRRDRNNVKWKNAPPSSQQEPEIQCRLSTWLRGRQGMIMGLHSWTRQKGMTGMLKEDLGLSISGNSKGGTQRKWKFHGQDFHLTLTHLPTEHVCNELLLALYIKNFTLGSGAAGLRGSRQTWRQKPACCKQTSPEADLTCHGENKALYKPFYPQELPLSFKARWMDTGDIRTHSLFTK